MDDSDRTASLMTPAKLAKVKPREPVSPAAWLDQMAADAGRQHVARLSELCAPLLAFAEGDDVEPLAAHVQALSKALKPVDFGLLQARGLWARATGQARRAGEAFAAQVEQVDQAVQDLITQSRGWQARRPAEAGTIDRALVEFGVEFRAIEKIIDQGSRWLQDMRTQLKQRQAGAPDAQALQQIKDDVARCEILVARLKSLRAVSGSAQQVHQVCEELATLRAALPKAVQQSVLPQVTALQQRLVALCGSAGDGGSELDLREPANAQGELRLGIKLLLTQRQQAQVRAKSLAADLAALRQQLQATG